MQVNQQFSMQRAQAFLEKFNSNVKEIHTEWDGSPDDDGYGKDVEVMVGRDEILMTFDRDFNMTSGNFEHNRMYHRADSGNGVTTYSMKGRGLVESVTVNDETREIVGFKSNKQGPAIELPGQTHNSGSQGGSKVYLA